MSEKKIKITQVRSTNQRNIMLRSTLTALGLGKIHRSVTQPDSASIRGQVNKLRFMLKVEEI